MSDLERVCTILDHLTLDALSLMEEEITAKLNVENAMCNGESHLAKSRYILGTSSVSSIQIPSENGSDLEATLRVQLDEDEEYFEQGCRRLESVKKDQVDPVRWFGYLVPQDLYHAQNMFKQALQWTVKAANIQTQLHETCVKIEQLKEVKKELQC